MTNKGLNVLFGDPEMSGFLRLVFDESGQWTDVLVAESQGDLPPEPGEYTSLIDELDALLDNLEQDYGIEIADPELRVTLDEDGEFELNFIIPDLGVTLQTLIEQSLATLDGEEGVDLEVDLSGLGGLPDLPIVSFIGQLEVDSLEGNILLGPLFEPSEFLRD